MSVFSVSFIVFSRLCFFMLSVNPLCSIVLLPYSAIFTNLILFIFHVPNTTVKPLCNLSLPLSAQPVAVDCIVLNYWGNHKRKMAIRGIN